MRQLFPLIVALFCIAESTPAAASLLERYRAGEATATLDLEIGGEDADDASVIYGPADIAVDSEGNIYVLDFKLFCIKKYAPDGTHLMDIGREGEGPGEFLGPFGLTVTGDGHLITFDSNLRRFQVFSTDGEYVSSHPYQGTVQDLDAEASGTLLATCQQMNFTNMDGMAGVYLTRFDDGFNATDLDSMRTKLFEALTVGDAMMMVSAPFPAFLKWAIAPDGTIVFARSDRYELKIMSPDWKLIRTIKRDAPRPKVRDADRNAYLTSWAQSFNATEEALDNVSFPAHKSYFNDIVVDHEGNILVRLNVDIEGGGSDATFDVFSPDGDYVGQVVLADVSQGAIFRNGFIYDRKWYKDQLPTVRRFRLE